ncbi:MAG: serine hydrolase domain-containing protein [Actinomycetota bacterium]
MRWWSALVLVLALFAASCGSSAVEDAIEEAVEPDATSAPATAVPPTAVPPTAVPPTAVPPTPVPPTPVPPTPVPPTPVPAPDYAAELQAALDDWRAQTGAPGAALAVIRDGEVVADLASGTVALGGDEPVTPENYFRIASITKPMTSAVVLQLVEDGLLELDAPVTDYLGGEWLGEHANATTITVRQLLDHTNGLIEYAFDPGFYFEAALRQDTPFEPEEILEFLGRQDPLFEPGTAYQYETGGFVAAGLIIEEVTGNSAAEEMRSRLFEPAGAANIFLTPEEFPPEPVVNAYARAELYLALRLLPGVEDAGQTLADGDPVIDVLSGPQEVLQSAGWTGGGNEARMESVARVFAAMFDGSTMSPESIEAMTTTVLDVNYGLGIDASTEDVEGYGPVTVWQHGGGVPGFRSQAGWLPDHGISYALSTSLIPLPDGTDVGVLQDEVLRILLTER